MEKSRSDRILWIDTAKMIACVLVVIGHILRGLSTSEIFTGPLSAGLIRFVYFFHVKVFFFCSGYLYRTRCKPGFAFWKKNILHKLIDLGIPYVVFTTAAYILKTLFENDINDPVHVSLFETLLYKPESPYWFLYVLFLMFLLIPPVKSRKILTVYLSVSVVFFAAAEIVGQGNMPFLAEYFMSNMIWFMLGIFCAEYGWLKERVTLKRAAPAFLFIPAAAAVCALDIRIPVLVGLIMGAWGVLMTVCIAKLLSERVSPGLISVLSSLTMPIYLMHTLATPMIRIVLMKAGIASLVPHLLIGFIGAILLPSFAYLIMHLLVFPEFVINPRKTLRRIKEGRTRKNAAHGD